MGHVGWVCSYIIFVCLDYSGPNILWVQSGSRLFGFIGAGATLGQLFGSLFAIGMAFVGPCKFAFALNNPFWYIFALP